MKTPKNQTYTSNNFIDLHINLDKKHLFDNISERKILQSKVFLSLKPRKH